MMWVWVSFGVALFFVLMYASIYAAGAHDKLDKVNERLLKLEADAKETDE